MSEPARLALQGLSGNSVAAAAAAISEKKNKKKKNKKNKRKARSRSRSDRRRRRSHGHRSKKASSSSSNSSSSNSSQGTSSSLQTALPQIRKKPFKPTFYKRGTLPETVVTYAALPTLAIKEALHVIDPTRCSQMRNGNTLGQFRMSLPFPTCFSVRCDQIHMLSRTSEQMLLSMPVFLLTARP
jgi:hypothetical protein